MEMTDDLHQVMELILHHLNGEKSLNKEPL